MEYMNRLVNAFELSINILTLAMRGILPTIIVIYGFKKLLPKNGVIQRMVMPIYFLFAWLFEAKFFLEFASKFGR